MRAAASQRQGLGRIHEGLRHGGAGVTLAGKQAGNGWMPPTRLEWGSPMTSTIMASNELAYDVENLLATKCGVCRIVPKIWEVTMFEADQFGWTNTAQVASRYLALLRDHLNSSRLTRG
jgi:hypothetical protein